MPVINENDTTTTDEISFGNNDFLAAQVAILLGAEQLLLLTDAEGVFTADPRANSEAELISEVREFAELDGARHRLRQLAAGLGRDALEGGGGRDGHRCRDPDGDLQRAGPADDPVGRGRRPRRHHVRGVLGAVLELQAVAEVRQAGARQGRRRRWRGAGAARGRDAACCQSGSSTSSGEFDPGDAVEIAHDGEVVGKGICNYSADELRSVRGLKSTDVRGVLPRASEEAVHRDYFVLA